MRPSIWKQVGAALLALLLVFTMYVAFDSTSATPSATTITVTNAAASAIQFTGALIIAYSPFAITASSTTVGTTVLMLTLLMLGTVVLMTHLAGATRFNQMTIIFAYIATMITGVLFVLAGQSVLGIALIAAVGIYIIAQNYMSPREVTSTADTPVADVALSAHNLPQLA